MSKFNPKSLLKLCVEVYPHRINKIYFQDKFYDKPSSDCKFPIRYQNFDEVNKCSKLMAYEFRIYYVTSLLFDTSENRFLKVL